MLSLWLIIQRFRHNETVAKITCLPAGARTKQTPHRKQPTTTALAFRDHEFAR